jgi:hypothetical protein
MADEEKQTNENSLEGEFREEVICRMKEKMASKPMLLWDWLPEDKQLMLWKLQFLLCCKAMEKMQEGFGYFCMHSEPDGYTGHWVSEKDNPAQCKELQNLDKANTTPMKNFWACFSEGGEIPRGCYQMRFPCEMALAQKFFQALTGATGMALVINIVSEAQAEKQHEN